ncbi:hypothetical protein RvY_16504 [Ramazzottius varieornatus]|uniref:Uncharacterized protein n=1 Tax=Ramazzottius varieornatus TaxID=947166 RepID=A0A1D1VYQ2_RAMVA|nr:hypothetical protein RvY_16504 [Ramazzottius varieornatus]
MCNWHTFKKRLKTWAFRAPESQLVKFSRVNPAYPFERRTYGVYVFSKKYTNHLRTAFWLLLACGIYFAIIFTGDPANYITRIDTLFFPVIGTFIAFWLIWRFSWSHTIVLNYPKFRYEYYIGEQIMSVGPVVDLYVRMKVLFAGEEDMFYHIAIGAKYIPEIEFTQLSANGNLYRRVGKRLAETLHVNYFDIMDLSPLHDCRHPTTRHLDNLMHKNPGMRRQIEQQMDQKFLVAKLDRFRKCDPDPLDQTIDPCDKPNWPFSKPDALDLGVPLERVKRIRAEERALRTMGWYLRQIPLAFSRCFRSFKNSIIGRSHDENIELYEQHKPLLDQTPDKLPPADQKPEATDQLFVSKGGPPANFPQEKPAENTPVAPVEIIVVPPPEDTQLPTTPTTEKPAAPAVSPEEEEELDDQMRYELISELNAAERELFWSKAAQLVLPFRTGKFTHKMPLSLEQQTTMTRVTRFMTLRNQVKGTGQEVPPIPENMDFVNVYMAHRKYPKFYQAALLEMDPRWTRKFKYAGRNNQVHPVTPPKSAVPTIPGMVDERTPLVQSAPMSTVASPRSRGKLVVDPNGPPADANASPV